MSRKDKIYISIICFLFAMVLITGTHIIPRSESVVEWFSESVHNGDYIISGDMIVDSIFNGATEVNIFINDRKDYDKSFVFATRVDNNGNKLTKDNYKIEGTEEYIKIELIDYDGRVQAYRFFFEDFIN